MEKLQTFEKAHKVVRLVNQGAEGVNFLQELWGFDKIL